MKTNHILILSILAIFLAESQQSLLSRAKRQCPCAQLSQKSKCNCYPIGGGMQRCKCSNEPQSSSCSCASKAQTSVCQPQCQKSCTESCVRNSHQPQLLCDKTCQFTCNKACSPTSSSSNSQTNSPIKVVVNQQTKASQCPQACAQSCSNSCSSQPNKSICIQMCLKSCEPTCVQTAVSINVKEFIRTSTTTATPVKSCVSACQPTCDAQCIDVMKRYEVIIQKLPVVQQCPSQCQPTCSPQCIQSVSVSLQTTQATTAACIPACQPACQPQCIQAVTTATTETCIPACQPACQRQCVEAQLQIQIVTAQTTHETCIPACQPACQPQCVYQYLSGASTVPPVTKVCISICQPACDPGCVAMYTTAATTPAPQQCVSQCQPACLPSCTQSFTTTISMSKQCVPECQPADHRQKLSLGMSQHITLGKKLRNRYVNTGNSTYNFLPPVYDQKTMYVRSTGINRTLISATSNMLGMYGQDGYGNTAGTDFPDVQGWPRGFVPIPIHTVDYDSDHIGNMDSDCPRREWLWGLAQQSDEVRNWRNSTKVTSVMQNLTSLVNETWSLEDFWVVPDALFIEQIYYNETLRHKNTWFTDDFYNQIVDVNDQIYMFQYGIFDNPVKMQNMDIGLELLKIRSGPLMNDIVDRIEKKSDCTFGKNVSGCDWINNLRYYAYSAHDETVYAVLVALGIERYAIIPHGYPFYSAAVSLEYWRNTTDNGDYFKVVYHKQAGDDFTVMTREIDGCSDDYCSMDILKQVALKLKPDQPIDQWCLVTESSSSSSFSVIFWISFIVILKEVCA